jgi:hypothetical protein
MLVITCGDIAAGQLAEAGVATEPALVWRDLLHEGPVPAGPDPALREARARFAADAGWVPYDVALADYAARDARVEALGPGDRVLLCFDHNLVNQLQLVQLLAVLPEHAEAELLTVTEFGGATPAELAAAPRRPVGPPERALGRAAWSALRAPDPTAIEQLLPDTEPGIGPLPALGPALRRFLAGYPGTRDGLSLTQRRALQAAPGTFAELFEAVAAQEDHRYLGDTLFRAELDELTWAAVPLLSGPPPRVPGPVPRVPGRPPREAAPDPASPGPLGPGLPADPEDRWQRTAAGTDVLVGRADHVALNGIDRWLGGVHLHGTTAAWRWTGTALQPG